MMHKVNGLLLLCCINHVTNVLVVQSFSLPTITTTRMYHNIGKIIRSSSLRVSSHSYYPHTTGHLQYNTDRAPTPTRTYMNNRRHHGTIESSLLRSLTSQDPPTGLALYGSINNVDNDIEADSSNNKDSELQNDNGTDEDEKERNIVQAILSLALPALAGLVIDPLMTLADTVFVGREATNADSLAGKLIFQYMYVYIYIYIFNL